MLEIWYRSLGFPESKSQGKIWAPLGIKCNWFLNPQGLAYESSNELLHLRTASAGGGREKTIHQLLSPTSENIPPHVGSKWVSWYHISAQYEGPRAEGQMHVLRVWGKASWGCSRAKLIEAHPELVPQNWLKQNQCPQTVETGEVKRIWGVH